MKTILSTTLLGLFMLGIAAQANAEESAGRLFEMRTYTTHPGKLEALHARFRDHTNKIFAKHGMTMIGYWTPDTPAGEEANTLVYILAYPDMAAREKAWTDFKSDPDWQAAYKASHEDGPIVKKVESKFMHATDYSLIK